jgi:thiamine transport system permease protein
MIGRAVRIVSVAFLAAFLAVFFVYPVGSILSLGVRSEGVWRWREVMEVVTDPATRSVVWFTLWQASVSTLLTVVVAVPGAYTFARLNFPGRSLLRSALTVPFVLPTTVVGAAFLAVLGPGGVLPWEWDQSVTAILLAHVFFNYSVIVRMLGGVWSQVDAEYEEAARALGARGWQVWCRVYLPAIGPALAGASLIVFLFTFTSFGVITVLGGPRFATLEVEIYRQTTQALNLPAAAVLTLLQMAVVLAVLALSARVTRRRRPAEILRAGQSLRRPRGLGEWGLVVATTLLVLGFLVGPCCLLAVRSFSGTHGFTLDFYRSLVESNTASTLSVEPVAALATSLRYATAATLLAVALGSVAASALARRPTRWLRGLDLLVLLPLGTSAVTVGFGFLVALDKPPLDFRDSELLVPLAQAMVALPLVARSLVPVLRDRSLTQREAASLLGATRLRAWIAVDLPVVWRALAAAAGFAFAVSLGEFGATVFLARPDTPTVPIAIYRLLSRPGELMYGQAMALATILMLLCALVLWAMDRVRVERRDTAGAASRGV